MRDLLGNCNDGLRGLLIAFATNNASGLPGRAYIDIAPLPRGESEREQVERADRYPHEPQCRKADGGRHAAHLAVFAFRDLHFDPRRRNLRAITHRRYALPEMIRRIDAPCTTRLCHIVAQVDAAFERAQRVVADSAVDLRPVAFDKFVTGFGDARLQGAVVGQQEEPFAVGVEPSRRIDTWHVDVRGKRGPRFVRRELADRAKRFVQSDQAHGEKQAGKQQRMAEARSLLHNGPRYSWVLYKTCAPTDSIAAASLPQAWARIAASWIAANKLCAARTRRRATRSALSPELHPRRSSGVDYAVSAHQGSGW
ncbi:protein of unknown function [Pararobbsia alpina]